MIPVRNIYYMLSYAFSALRSRGFADLGSEDFDNAADLLAAILARGMAQQVKRGLRKDYVSVDEVTNTPRGKIDVSASVKGVTMVSGKLACRFDEFTKDVYLNQVLKTAALRLLREDISCEQKKDLRRQLAYFEGVSEIPADRIDWNIRYDRCTQTYRMLMSVCRLALEGLVHSPSGSGMRIEDFDEERMCDLYERFVREYFRIEHGDAVTSKPAPVQWALDGGNADLLPAMRTDITLESKDLGTKRVLIIDTKYYSRTLQQSQYGRRSIHSGNLYQIFSYVKNKDEGLSREGVEHEVSGMLLYARTDDQYQPDEDYQMSGNAISVKTLDLSCEFPMIRKQLDAIFESAFC